MKKLFKRYCKILELQDDPQLIKEYKKLHAMGAAWPEITQGMKDVGIIDMEIYLSGKALFMIMETVLKFNHDQAMAKLATLPRQAEWEELVSKFQKTSSNASAKEKWKLMERIYKMEQKKEYPAIEGQLETVTLN